MPAVHRTVATADCVRAMVGVDPVSVADLKAAGITYGQVRAAVRSGGLVRVRDGVVAVPLPQGSNTYDTLRRGALACLLRLHPAAAASHETAGDLLRLPRRRPGIRQRSDVVVTAPRSGGRQTGLRVVSGQLEDADVAVVDGVRCTALCRTALDLAIGRPLPEALVVLDAALGREGPDALESAYGRLSRVRGLTGLVRALRLADQRSESPLESASRGVMHDAGLPSPELQQWVVDDEGRAWRVDFLWRGQRVIGEADGWVKYESIADVRAEKRREDALRRAGWTIVRWTSDELWHTPHAVVARIERALGC